MLRQHICFIGAGAMAEAIIAGLLKSIAAKDNISVINKADMRRLDILEKRFDIHCPEKKERAITCADIVILAVKPADVHEAMRVWGKLLKPEKHLLISVVAGVPAKRLESYMEDGVPVIRAMPNTSSTIGQSATAIAPGRWADAGHLQLTERIFKAIGTVVTLEEEYLNAVTALSGSGPAFVYFFVEALEQAGVTAGLNPDLARKLTVQTLFGAAEMLVAAEEEPKRLRHKVTSPGGTTAAGLDALKSHGFSQAVQAAVLSARDRAKQMEEDPATFPVKEGYAQS